MHVISGAYAPIDTKTYLKFYPFNLSNELGQDSSSQLQLLGTLHFPHFKRKKAEDWLVWVFRAEISESQVQEVGTQGPEGDLKWIPLSEVMELNLWAGDRKFLPKVLVGGTFWGTIWYEDERVIRAEVHPLV